MRAILFLGLFIFTVSSPIALADPSSDAKKEATAITAVTTHALSDSANDSAKQIENTVHQYLLKKPEVVVEALQAYQQKQMESMQQLFKQTQQLAPKYADNLFHQDSNPIVGNAKGKVTVVEFSDYQCAHCIEMSPVLDAVIKANPNLKVVFKEFPIRGGLSEEAARAALAANKQGKYSEFRDALFKVSAHLTADKIYEVAKMIGLNVEQLKKDMNDKAIRGMVQADQKLAMALKLIGTPAFFIANSNIKNGASVDAISYIPGIASQQQLQTLIDKAMK